MVKKARAQSRATTSALRGCVYAIFSRLLPVTACHRRSCFSQTKVNLAGSVTPFDGSRLLSGGAVALLSSAMGADPHLANKFLSELWLLAPTPNLTIYEI